MTMRIYKGLEVVAEVHDVVSCAHGAQIVEDYEEMYDCVLFGVFV